MKELGDAMAAATGYTSAVRLPALRHRRHHRGRHLRGRRAATATRSRSGPEPVTFHGPTSRVVDQWTRGDNPADSAKGGLREALLLAG